MHFSIREIIVAGWPVMSVLLLCSIISFAVVLDRWNYFRKRKINAQNFCDKLAQGPLKISSVPVALQPIANFVTENAKSSTDFLALGTQNLIRLEMLQAEQRIAVLGTLASATPFIGLLGTVIGIIRAFQTISFTGGGGAQVVAGGIAEALISTALGLIVAIPALIFYNVFSTRARTFGEALEISTQALIQTAAKN